MATPAWLAALNARSQGMNKLYGLPKRVAPPKPPAGVVIPPAVNTGGVSAEDWARQQATAYIQAQIDAINAQKQAYLDDLTQQSNLEIQRGQALSQALQSLNLPAQIQGVYQNASSDIGGLANAFAGSLRQTAQADTAAQQRMLSGSGQEGAVANNGTDMGDVVYGQSGYVPAKSLSEAGAAFGAEAALEPSYAQRIGQVKAADVYSQGLEGLKQFTQALMDAEAQRPQVESDALKQYNDALDSQRPDISYRNLANGQIQAFDDKTGMAVGPPQGPKKVGSKTTKNTIRSLANGQLQAFSPSGKPVGKPYGPVRVSTAADHLTARSLANGQIQWFDPSTGRPVGGPQGPVRKTTKKTGGKTYNLQLKKLADGSQQWFDPHTGKAVGAPITPPANSKPKYTAYQLRQLTKQAGDIASKAWNGVKTTQDGVTGLTHMNYQEAMREGLSRGIPLSVMQSSLNRYWTKPGYDRDFTTGKWVKNIHGTGRPLKTFQQRNPQEQAQASSLPKVPKADILPASWTPTHVTDGLGWGTKTAVDLFPGPAGTPVGSPVSGTVLYFHPDGAIGGGSMEIQGDDGYVYFLAHLDNGVAAGTHVDRGSQIALVSSRESPNHVHIDRKRLGRRA